MRSGSSSRRRSEEISFLDKPGDLNLRTARRRPGVVQCADIWQILPRIWYLEISKDISQLAHHNHNLSIYCLVPGYTLLSLAQIGHFVNNMLPLQLAKLSFWTLTLITITKLFSLWYSITALQKYFWSSFSKCKKWERLDDPTSALVHLTTKPTSLGYQACIDRIDCPVSCYQGWDR